MDIRTLSERTGFSIRQIRYVIDHELVPQRGWFVDEHAVGRARQFEDTTAILIACAAYLLEAGYKRDSVSHLLNAISQVKPTNRNQLGLPLIAGILTSNSVGQAQFGDGQYVRWITNRSTGKWIDPGESNKSVAELTPKVIVELNVGEIRDQVLGRKSSS